MVHYNQKESKKLNMIPLNDNSKNRILKVILILICMLFLLSLFKNISYPLFWADESMTVMGGVRVLEFGYPKVHDGKNVLYDLRHPNLSLGIDEKTDAYIGGANWGQYYFATLGIKLAELSDDLFTKTGIIRITFALTGLAGLVILALLGRQFFHAGLPRTGFLAIFAFFELISIPLVLHLREARYYPLTLFVIAFTLFVYARFRIFNIARYWAYALLLVISLFLLFINFSPVYFMFLLSFVLYESILMVKNIFSDYREKKGGWRTSAIKLKEIFGNYLLALAPMLVSLITVLPLISFFKTFYIAEEMTNYNLLLFNTSRLDIYVDNLSVIWRYFASSDFIYLAIFAKICLVLSTIKSTGKDIADSDKSKIRFTVLLTIIFMTYLLAIARIPNFPFTRYFIPLQPILALIIILDLAVVFNMITRRESTISFYYKVAVAVIFVSSISYNISKNIDHIRGHMYEMTHQYMGPLDYVIPFIKDGYAQSDGLVIATNYEETSFMYYLGSKVVVGFVGNNLEQDSQTVPDIIVFRKWHMIFMPIFTNFLQQRAYNRISFPVTDYPVNNLPELNWAPPFQHQFRTEEATNDMEKVDMYVREGI
jgi:uncharacterized membrane protein YuzA (DUF378 family)